MARGGVGGPAAAPGCSRPGTRRLPAHLEAVPLRSDPVALVALTARRQTPAGARRRALTRAAAPHPVPAPRLYSRMRRLIRSRPSARVWAQRRPLCRLVSGRPGARCGNRHISVATRTRRRQPWSSRAAPETRPAARRLRVGCTELGVAVVTSPSRCRGEARAGSP